MGGLCCLDFIMSLTVIIVYIILVHLSMLFYHFDVIPIDFVWMHKSDIRNLCILNNYEQKKVSTMSTYQFDDKTQLSAHFNVQEFKCQCGKSHAILIDSGLIDKLEQLYTALNCSKIIVTSGYRCPEHDKAVGGTSSGQHTKGTAADVCCYGQDGQPISSKTVCCKAQDLGFTGIANITAAYQYTHLDVRTSGKWYGDEIHGNGTVTDDFYKYFGLTSSKNILYGIDVSYCQQKIDWEKVKASGKVSFALIRAGFGKVLKNQVDDSHQQEAKCSLSPYLLFSTCQ